MYGMQYCADTTTCSLLPGNQILISKYLARRGVVVSGGWSNGSGWQQTTNNANAMYGHVIIVMIDLYCSVFAKLENT